MKLTEKIVVNVTPEQSEILQLVAFQQGFSWVFGSSHKVEFIDMPYLFFNMDKSLTHCDHYTTGKLLSFQDALAMLLGVTKTISVRVGQYDATVSQDSIKVGCTTIDRETVEKLIEAWNSLQ